MIKLLFPSIMNGLISSQLRVNELVNFLKVLDYCIERMDIAKQLYFKKAILLKIQALLDSTPIDNKTRIITDIANNSTLSRIIACYASQLNADALFSREDLTRMLSNHSFLRQLHKKDARFTCRTFRDLSIIILVNHAQAENSLLDRVVRYTSRPLKKQSNSGSIIDQSIKELNVQAIDRSIEIPNPLALPPEYLDISVAVSSLKICEATDYEQSSKGSFERTESQFSSNGEFASSSSLSSPPASPGLTERKSWRTWGQGNSSSAGTLEVDSVASISPGSSPVASAPNETGIKYGLKQSRWGSVLKKAESLVPESSGNFSPKKG